jgi:hypothetical protein
MGINFPWFYVYYIQKVFDPKLRKPRLMQLFKALKVIIDVSFGGRSSSVFFWISRSVREQRPCGRLEKIGGAVEISSAIGESGQSAMVMISLSLYRAGQLQAKVTLTSHN